ncbi:hypothetical protein ACFPOA_01440 [Lysobacter niabensis]|uniref:hypothetical protein n=1 Tax=Agrilutibacter niabensis TaxID=380628 RepID=UPI00360950EC
MRVLSLLLFALSLPAAAAGPKPEVARDTGKPQAAGAVHTVRAIPEACARLEGMFTGDAAQPYRFAPVRSSPNCQPRARFVDFAKAKPSEASGWKFNDEIRIPNAACPSQLAVVRVWRKPANVAPPKLDEQGRSRIYLQEAREQAKEKGAPNVPMFAAEMKLEGKPCGG